MMFTRNSDAQVPQSAPLGFGNFPMDDGLHTPNQNVPMPMYDARSSTRPPRINQGEWNPNGYRWKNMSRMMMSNQGSWNEPTYFDPSRPNEMALGFSKDDVEYAKLSERKNREIILNLSTRQKRLMKALNSGKLFKLSRLVPEKDRVNNQ